MFRTLTTKLYLKPKLGSDLVEHLTIFNQKVANLARREITVDDEDMAIILLCFLSPFYEHVVTTMTYGKKTIKIEDILIQCCLFGNRGGRTM